MIPSDPPGSSALARAGEARANVARVIALLETPTVAALDQSTAELACAVASMRQIQGCEPVDGVKSAIGELRKDLARAGLLLRHAWEFRVCGQSGYTSGGELAPKPVSTVRWAIEA